MKKKLAAILAGLMVLAMGTTVFAETEGSPSVTSKDQEAQAYKDKISAIETNSGTVSYTAVDAAVMDDAKTAAANAGTVKDVLAIADVNLDNMDVSKGVTLTFRVSGVSAGDNVYALHQLRDGTWEVCNTVVGDGYVKVTLYSLSPVAIVKYEDGVNVTPNQVVNPTPDLPQAGEEGLNTAGTINNYNTTNNYTTNNSSTPAVVRTSSGTTSVTTSPKTGASAPAIPIVAMLALMGIVVFAKKAQRL